MNQKNSVYLAIAQLVILLGMIILAWANHAWPPLWLQWLTIVVTLITAYINFKNTFSTNDDWKTYIDIGAIFLTVTIYAIPIGIHYNHTH